MMLGSGPCLWNSHRRSAVTKRCKHLSPSLQGLGKVDLQCGAGAVLVSFRFGPLALCLHELLILLL